jgi:hypothetical protein
MTRTRRADTAKLRDDREGERFAGAGAFGDGSIDKAATGRNKAGAAFRGFGPRSQKVETGFWKKIMVKQKGGRPNRVPPMRQDRLGEG